MNRAKTFAMHLTSLIPNDLSLSLIQYNGIETQFVESGKFLGVFIHNNLKFNFQINSVASKLAKTTGIF